MIKWIKWSNVANDSQAQQDNHFNKGAKKYCKKIGMYTCMEVYSLYAFRLLPMLLIEVTQIFEGKLFHAYVVRPVF